MALVESESSVVIIEPSFGQQRGRPPKWPSLTPVSLP